MRNTASGNEISEPLDADYLALVRRVPLVPITSKALLKSAGGILAELGTRYNKLSRSEKSYFSVLSLLVHEYEKVQYPRCQVSPRELLQVIVEEHGLRYTDLAPEFGGHSQVTDFFKGRRQLSKRQIARLAERFAIDQAALMDRESEREPA